MTARAVATYAPSTTTANGSITIPATAVPGVDVALLMCGLNTGTGTMTTPAGWTLVSGPLTNGTTQRVYLFKRALTSSGAGSPGSSVALGWSQSGRMHAALAVVPSTTQDIDAFTPWTDNTADTTMSIPAHTPGVDNAQALVMASSRNTAGGAISVTFPAAWAERADVYTAYPSGITYEVAVADRDVTTAAGVAIAASNGTYNTAAGTIGFVITVPDPSLVAVEGFGIPI